MEPTRTEIEENTSQMEFQTDGPLAKAASRVVILEVVEGDTKDPARGVTPQRRPPRLKVFLYDAWADACRNVAKDDLLSLTVPIQLVTAAEERDVGDLEQWVLFAPVAMVKRHSALLDGLGAKERARVGGCGALALKRVVERSGDRPRQVVDVGAVSWGAGVSDGSVELPRRPSKREVAAEARAKAKKEQEEKAAKAAAQAASAAAAGAGL